MFSDVQITDEGHRYLGSYIGSASGKDKYVADKVDEWIQDVKDISDIAKREPQLAYAGYIYGLSKRWNYLCRTTPDVSHQMKKLEFTVQETFIPAILDRAFSGDDTVREIFALPAREGGLSIYDISKTSDMEYNFSCRATKELTDAIYEQQTYYTEDHRQSANIKADISKERSDYYKLKKEEILQGLSDSQKTLIKLAGEKGASSWLTSLPVKAFGYVLNKQEFNDALTLRYNMDIKNAPI